jgi:hypothetical protein
MSTAVVGALITASVVVGVGAADTAARVSEADSWLASLAHGTLVHVNGTNGRVDGRVQLGEDTEGPLEVVQDSGNVLVLDRSSGVVTRIDPAQLSVAQTQSFEGARLRIVAADDDAWVVDQAAGVVQRIDPVTLAALGKPVNLPSRPVGSVRADDDGVLWVVLPERGEVVPVGKEKTGDPVKAGQPGEPLRLTVAMGRAAVVNTKAGTLTVLSEEAEGMAIRLPSAVSAADPAKVLVPENNASPLVPLLAPDSGVLVVANVESGVVQAAGLDLTAAASYGPPQAHGQRVYIPDTSAGGLLVYDTVTARFDPPVRVTGQAGQLDVYTRGDRLWVNDQANATAAVVDEEGVVHLIDKYDKAAPGPGAPSATSTTAPDGDQGLPGPERADESEPAAPRGSDPTGAPQDLPGSPPDSDQVDNSPQDTPDQQDNGSTNGQNTDGPSTPERPAATVTVTAPPPAAPAPPVIPPVVVTVPAPQVEVPAPGPAVPPPAPAPSTATPRPTPPQTTPSTAAPGTPPPPPPAEPGPPGRPKAQTGADRITVTFAPSGGATPDHYELEGAPKGAAVKPSTVSAKGPFRFEVSGLACDADAEYTFKVVAVLGTERYASAASPAVRPCVAPAAPTITKKDRANHQIALTWKAPVGAGLTYKVAWKGAGSAPDGSQETTGTSLTIRGLTNGKVYDITVTAVNAAGSSPAARTSVDMTPPKKTLQVHHNRDDDVDMGIRTLPDSQAGDRAGAIPPGYNGDITVHCQVKGSTERRLDGTGGNSAIWDKVTYKGVTGYLSDVYVATTNSGKNSYSSELWQCE